MGSTHSIGMSTRLFRTTVKRTGEELITKRNRNSKAVAKGADFKAAVVAVNGGVKIKDIKGVMNFKEIIISKATTRATTMDRIRTIIRENPGDKLEDAGGTNILLSDERK